MNLNGVEYYYIRNAQSDIIGLFNNEGTQVVSYVYDSWGKLEATTGTFASTVGVKNPYRYKGYRYDTEIGLYYLNSRYYNPEWGRFINADSIGGQVGDLLSHNIFSYCGNNPINRIDASGQHWYCLWLDDLFGVDLDEYKGTEYEDFEKNATAFYMGLQIDATFFSMNYADSLSSTLTWAAQQDSITESLTGMSNAPIVTPRINMNTTFSESDRLKSLNAGDVSRIAKSDGWKVGPLGKGSLKGVPFSQGGGLSIRQIGPKDRYLQWHPGGGHHGTGSYWKMSSGSTGTIRIFQD